MDETYAYRFGGIERLYSAEDLAWLGQAHIAVVGVGGVGAWTVEALARSGVGTLTLIDWDDICITNVNRQLHALDGTLGKAKVGCVGRAGSSDKSVLHLPRGTCVLHEGECGRTAGAGL